MKIDHSPITGYQAPAVHRAFDILKTVAASRGGMGISELAKQLGFSKSTVLGLVQALVKVGALDRNPEQKKFFLGPVVVELTFKNWNYFRVAEHSQPLLDRLRDRVDETVFLGALSRFRALIVATAEATKPLKISSPPGTTIPLLAGAVGKVFLAQRDDAEVLEFIKESGLPQFTSRSIVYEEEYLAELALVRNQGYALDNGEYLRGVRAVAVGLGNHRGLPLAIWVVGFSGSMGNEMMPQIIEATTETAKTLRAALRDNS